MNRLYTALLLLLASSTTTAFVVTPTTTPAQTRLAAAAENDILNTPAFLQRKLEVLQTDYAKAEEALQAAQERLEQGKAEWGPQMADLQVEYQNIQKRMNAQSKGGDSMATVQVARNMLNVLDNFDRAFGAVVAETESEQAIETEYKVTYQMMLDAFAEMGVEEVPTLGVEFDYQVHQAVMQKPSDEYEEGIVCEEFQKGFKCGDQLVRAAMVAVAV